jgi:hypothetical protein
MSHRLITATLAVAALIAGCAGDDDDAVTITDTEAATTGTPSTDRPSDAVLGAAAVSQALGVDLLDDEQFAAACELFLGDPDEFAETIATGSRAIGGDEIQPSPADVLAWGEIACG